MKPDHIHADSSIIIKLKNNDEGAMMLLYKLHWKNLFISAYKVLKDKEACEDIIQDLFITIWKKRNTLNITTTLHSYLAAAVRYEVYRKIKNNKRYEPIADEMINSISAANDYSSIEHKELQLQIAAVISTLPPKCQEIYSMSRNELLSHKEIAGKLDITTKTVRNQITKALHQLRVNMNHYHYVTLVVYLLFNR